MKLNEPFLIAKTGKASKYYYAFAADGAGTYKLKINLAAKPTNQYGNVNLCVKFSDFNDANRQITKTYTPTGEYFSGLPYQQEIWQERFDVFTMQEGEILVFEIQTTKNMESDVTFEFIKG